MPFIEAAVIAVAEEAAAVAAAEAAAAAAAKTAAAAATEGATAAATEAAATAATEAAATAAAESAATAAATDTAASLGAGEASTAIGTDAATKGIVEAAPEILAQAAPEAGGTGASGIAEAAPGATQELAAQSAEATQAAATDVAQGTAQQPAGLEQVAPQQPAGMQQVAPQQPAGLEQIQPPPTQQPSADQLAQELQSQIQQAGQQPLQPSPYEPTASAQGTTDVGGQTLVEKTGGQMAPTETAPEGTQLQLQERMGGGAAGNGTEAINAPKAGTETNPFFQGMDKAMKYAPLAVLGAGVVGGMSSNQGSQPFPSTSYTGPLNKYKLSSDFKGSQATPQVYKPKYAAQGGIMDVGPVSQMTQNAIGQNRMYPQGQQDTTQFATPSQMPTSAEVVRSSYEQKTDPYTGAETFARGGKVPKDFESQFDYFASMMEGQPASPSSDRGDPGIYKDTDPETRNKSALEATLIRQKKMNKTASIPAQSSGITGGSLGKVKVTPANVKEEKGGSADDDEFASGGIAQIKKYADGGYTPNKYSTPTLAAPRVTTRTEYSSDEMGNQTPYEVSETYYPSQSSLSSNFQRGAGVAPQRYTPAYQQMTAPPAGIVQAQPRMSAAERFAGRMPTTGGRSLESRFGGRMPAMAAGGQAYDLGSYASGGNPRLLRGPGDGMSDNIPATIGGKQPARLADGEFVFPADVVSALGNGSTEAGAKELYAMMDRIRHSAHGKKSQQRKVNPKKVLGK